MKYLREYRDGIKGRRQDRDGWIDIAMITYESTGTSPILSQQTKIVYDNK